MRSRCNDPKNIGFYLYGGREIKVCEEWSDFANFHGWAVKTGYTDNLTIDRIDTNGDYCPENCRWVTNAEQQRNKRTNVHISISGIDLTVVEWAEKLNVKKSKLYKLKQKPGRLENFIKSELEGDQENR